MSKRGQLVGELIAEKGLRQADVAERAGVRQGHLSELIAGKKAFEKLAASSFMRLCKALGSTPEFLYYGEGEKVSEARSSVEAELLAAFRLVPDEDKRRAIKMIQAVFATEEANRSAA